LQGLFGMVLFRVFMLYGLRFCGGGDAGILAGTTPAWIAVLAALLLGERPGRRTWAAVACAVCGAAAVNLAPSAPSGGTLLGAGLILAAVLSESLLTILRKAVGATVSAVTNTTVLVAASALLTGPLAAAEHAVSSFTPDRDFLLGVLYHGLVATDLGYLCFMAGASRVSASTAGVLSAALPVSAVGLSALLLREPLGWAQLAGCALVGAGVVTAASGREPSPAGRQAEPPSSAGDFTPCPPSRLFAPDESEGEAVTAGLPPPRFL
ncbi:MAG: DMT family transporter, partial [Deltaproteobacteria bacterium]|nr:DMT family transporter [Deltaproteobacteria bacterium]